MRRLQADDEAVSPAAHDRLVERTRHLLLRRSAPRLQMSFIVSGTGAAGLGASVVLRRLGLDDMGLRYGLAVACAYLAFLLLLRAWLAWQQRAVRRADVRSARRGSGLDLADLPLPELGEAGQSPWSGSGGHFAGGGASEDLSLAKGAPAPREVGSSLSGSGGRTGGGGFSLDLDLDEFVVVVLVLLAVASAVFAAGYVVYEAPTLLADVLVDGAISAGLYRRLRQGSSGPWWTGAIRRTIIPAIVVLLFFVVAGLAARHVWPEARTLGDVWRLFGTRAG